MSQSHLTVHTSAYILKDMYCFEWDEAKSRANKLKHGISFETATLIFQDPNILSVLDRRFEYDEERWISIGEVGGVVVLVVAHTEREDDDGEEIIRLISARKATGAEIGIYHRGIT
ncbi:MAG: hypothetical protein A2289_07215 [Deltaproteobacteria bacterium RIFOXYA12_FULL_58_15]|nr:MAG: hypothetical protein A2289_07215 [Deltaproteobacteria bacterium RIFOXYA12_FULL_58_15]